MTESEQRPREQPDRPPDAEGRQLWVDRDLTRQELVDTVRELSQRAESAQREQQRKLHHVRATAQRAASVAARVRSDGRVIWGTLAFGVTVVVGVVVVRSWCSRGAARRTQPVQR